MGGAWYKVSNGGNWFVCGWVGKDATYSVPVSQPGTTYVVDAIAPVGWKATTPRVKVVSLDAKGGAYLYTDLGFVRDPSVKTVEGCDQYNPVRR